MSRENVGFLEMIQPHPQSHHRLNGPLVISPMAGMDRERLKDHALEAIGKLPHLVIGLCQMADFSKARRFLMAYDREAIKLRGVDADINFSLAKYEDYLKQMKNLTKEEFVHILR
ncbi:hypothetical protein J5N97_026167 [Dioscorea zingiberensis]|uniref:Uncharacterized protein n=1 Tax=Dioscorea zingiberensis TaxID=325984 RepID=A0A9D5H693_9LILI|nr:hypothetical protein J5N97_026167 [Dioscorea zingiberensis]